MFSSYPHQVFIYLGSLILDSVTVTAHVASYRGPITVPPPIKERPPRRGLRPLLFTNSVWVP